MSFEIFESINMFLHNHVNQIWIKHITIYCIWNGCFAGIEVQQHEGGITLNQRLYALRILEEAGMKSCNSCHTPMEAWLKMSKADHDKEIDATNYRRNVGCLHYLLHTRPDVTYSVGVLSRYMHTLRESHGEAMKQYLRYLQVTMTYGITFHTVTRSLWG